MNPYKRPEMETDPDKLPGQIINRPDYPDAVTNDTPLTSGLRMEDHKKEYRARQEGIYLRDIIARIEEEEYGPYATINS